MLGPSDPSDKAAPSRCPIRWRCVDGIHVMYTEAETSVSEDLWDACMRDRDGPEIRGCLSIVGGDGVTQISRRQWLVSASIMIRRGFPVAMLSSHRITLAMVRSAAWSGANIRAFKWAELDAALEFIGVPPAGRAKIQLVARELRDHKGSSGPNGSPAPAAHGYSAAFSESSGLGAEGSSTSGRFDS